MKAYSSTELLETFTTCRICRTASNFAFTWNV